MNLIDQANALIIEKNYNMAGEHHRPEQMSEFTLKHFIRMLKQCKDKGEK